MNKYSGKIAFLFFLLRMLYHGSAHIIKDFLEPRPSRVIQGEQAVFATPSKWLALAFIPKAGDNNIGIGFWNDKGFISEETEGAFELLNVSGYIYTVNITGFKEDHRLGLKDKELINPNLVSIMSSERIENVFLELQKPEYSKEMNLITYKELKKLNGS